MMKERAVRHAKEYGVLRHAYPSAFGGSAPFWRWDGGRSLLSMSMGMSMGMGMGLRSEGGGRLFLCE